MFYSGIDQHKRDSYITTYGPESTIVKQERVPNSPLLIRRYFAQFPGPHKAVVESTGSWYWLADLLGDLGVELTLAHATRLKAISAAKVKTDKVDSDILALLLQADLIPEAHMIARERRAPRDLMRARLRLVEKCGSCKNSIERLLEKFNARSVAELDGLYRLQAASHELQIELLNQQRKALEAALHPHLIPNSDVQRMLWIPGIGKVNAFTIYTEIDDIERFPSVRQFFSYCRLVPGAQLGRQEPASLGLQGRQPLLEDRIQPRLHKSCAVLPRDPIVLPSQGQEEAHQGRSYARCTRDCPHRLPCAEYWRELQRLVQEQTARSNETAAVAAPGKPSRLTEPVQTGSCA